MDRAHASRMTPQTNHEFISNRSLSTALARKGKMCSLLLYIVYSLLLYIVDSLLLCIVYSLLLYILYYGIYQPRAVDGAISN